MVNALCVPMCAYIQLRSTWLGVEIAKSRRINASFVKATLWKNEFTGISFVM